MDDAMDQRPAAAEWARAERRAREYHKLGEPNPMALIGPQRLAHEQRENLQRFADRRHALETAHTLVQKADAMLARAAELFEGSGPGGCLDESQVRDAMACLNGLLGR